VTTAIRLEREVHERLRAAAAERQVSVNLLVEKAVADYLARLVPVEELQLTRPVRP
jgi:predicted HicB family RNase H-like nuclease